MANQFDRRRVNVKGGGYLQIREIDPTPATPFSTIGFISDGELIDEYTMVEAIDDSGNYIDHKAGGRKVTFKATLMQSSKDEIDLMRLAEGKYHEVYYKVTLNNGQIQEYVFPVCRLKPGAEMKFAAGTMRTIPLEIYALAPATALTRTPTAYNTVQWQPYVMTEGGAANNAPSDAGTVPQGGI